MWLTNLLGSILGHYRDHSLAYLISSMGFQINSLYVTYLFTGTNFMETLLSIESIVILLTIPSFIAVGYLTDRRMKLEKEFKDYSEQFEQKVGEMNLQLQKTSEELKTLDDMKDDIISNISHELKTPLTICYNAIALAMEEETRKEQEKLLEIGSNALLRQNNIIKDLVGIKKLKKDALDLNLEDMNIEEVIILAQKEIALQASVEGIKFKNSFQRPLPMVKADFNQLKQVVKNLLDNAKKFNRKGGNVTIKARAKGDFIEVCISDTGIGIAEENLEKVFDKFYQVDSSRVRKHSGIGMGLTVVKEIVEAHGGSIWVESTLGEGTTVYFTLPKAVMNGLISRRLLVEDSTAHSTE